MIIVSQDEKIILNFCNIQNIRIERYTTHEKGKYAYKIFAGNFEGYATEIGTYKTEERAKKVLQNILSRYEAIELCKYKSSDKLGYTLGDYTPIYEMPKD